MSAGLVAGPSRPAAARRLSLRLALCVGAVAVAGLSLYAVVVLLAPGFAAPPRSPFGVGFREAAPSPLGLGGWLLAFQASFSRSLEAAVALLGAGGDWLPVATIGFVYGVLHAAGPGHGKAVITGYIVAGERNLARGLSLSAAAALLQALVAIAVVGAGTAILGATASGMNRAGGLIETASFALVAALGLAVTWRKAGRLASLRSSDASCGPDCGHVHLTDAEALGRLETWRERAGVVLAAGSRPCAGAILILVFSASRGLLAAGILATLAMALGTALTTGALASLAVFAKSVALRLAGGRGRGGALALGALELLAAAFVLVLGAAMLSGLAVGAGG